MALFPELKNEEHIIWATFRGGNHTKLLRLDRPSLTVRGSALKLSKRTILGELVLFFCRDFVFFTASLYEGGKLSADKLLVSIRARFFFYPREEATEEGDASSLFCSFAILSYSFLTTSSPH